MSKKEIGQRHQTFLKKAFTLPHFRALISERVSRQLVELMPAPFQIIAERIADQVIDKAHEYTNQMVEKSEGVERLLS